MNGKYKRSQSIGKDNEIFIYKLSYLISIIIFSRTELAPG